MRAITGSDAAERKLAGGTRAGGRTVGGTGGCTAEATGGSGVGTHGGSMGEATGGSGVGSQGGSTAKVTGGSGHGISARLRRVKAAPCFAPGGVTPPGADRPRAPEASEAFAIGSRRRAHLPDSGGQVGELIARAEAAVSGSRWLEALDFASQALAVDPQLTEAAVLVGIARQRLGTVSAAGAELRQVTVIAVDMAASTAIAARLGPEAMRELMLALYEVCAEAVVRYEGRVTKYSGDGVLAQFGHPVAHDDDARRAVLAGLGILEAVELRAGRWAARYGEQVRVRVGVDSGLAAVGPMFESPWSPEEIAGDPPNVATRVQSTCQPMTIRITEATNALITGWFETVPIGEVNLRNYPRQVALHQVLQQSEADTRIEANVRPRPLLVNRERELSIMRTAWNNVIAERERHIVSIVGDGGIGKSRLAEHMLATAVASGASHLTLACSAVHRDSPLRPVARAVGRMFRAFPNEGGNEELWVDAIRRRLEQLPGRTIPAEEAVPIISWLLGIRDAIDVEPEELRRREFDVLLDLFTAMASESLVVLSVEDVDSADPSTLEFLGALLQRNGLMMLVLLTGRRRVTGLPEPDDVLELGGLNRSHAAMLARLVGPSLDEPAIEKIVSHSDGVPFFTEELARAAASAEAGVLTETVELTGFLTARLDELDPELKHVLRPIAVSGSELPLVVLRVLTELPADRLDASLSELHRRRVVVRTTSPVGDAVRFRHSLMRQAAYESILEARRTELHLRLATVMNESDVSFPPEDIAAQFELGGDKRSAAPRWLAAAERAAAAGANTEAVELYRRCLRALDSVPGDAEFGGLELAAQLGLGTILTSLEGYTSPRARMAFERAVTLAQAGADDIQLLPALWGAWAYWFVLGEHAVSTPLAARSVRIAADHPHLLELRLLASATSGYNDLYLGEFTSAREQLAWGARLRDVKPPEVFPHDPVVVAAATRAVTHWFLGESELSRELAADAHDQLNALDASGRRTPLTLCFAGCLLAWQAELDGDPAGAMRFAERATAVASERGYPTWVAAGMMHRSIALCTQGNYEEGLPTLEAVLTGWRTAGQDAAGRQLHPVLMTPYFAGRLAEARLGTGDASAAATELDRILRDTAENGERFWDVELLRVRAAARRALGADVESIESDVQRARAVARSQQAAGLLARLVTDEGVMG